MNVHDLPTPALVIDVAALENNIATMSATWPGRTLRPHVKAWKCTALAARLAANGHDGFCCATVREIEGMAAAGLGTDLLLANEVVGPAAARLGAVARAGTARVTAAIDSDATLDAAADAGVAEVLIDVNVGMPRCGCAPSDAGRLADRARARGLTVRGVMGYEGHLMMEPEETKPDKVGAAMALLLQAHADVGGDVISGGGTGTYVSNHAVTELQAGSFALMDTDYRKLGPAFLQALHLHATVISVGPKWAVADAGLKAMSLDHGNPSVEDGKVWFVSDEHTTFSPADDGTPLPRVGDHVRIAPSHIDPTIAMHERMHLVDGEEVIDVWAVDLRNW